MTEPPIVQSSYGIPFRGHNGIELTLDVHRRPGLTSAPVIVYWHGGGWAVGSSADNAADRLIPLAALGYVVVSANYTSSLKAIYPTQFGDVRGALAWTEANVASYNGDPSRVVVAGASSGAHLAAIAALTAHREFPGFAPVETVPRGALLYYPVLDPELRDREDAETPQPGPETFAGRFAVARGSWPPPPRGKALLGGRRSADFDPSPNVLSLDIPYNSPEFLFFHGSIDTSVGAHHSLRLHDRLVTAAVPSQVYLIGDADHADPRFFIGPAAAITADFLARLTS